MKDGKDGWAPFIVFHEWLHKSRKLRALVKRGHKGRHKGDIYFSYFSRIHFPSKRVGSSPVRIFRIDLFVSSGPGKDLCFDHFDLGHSCPQNIRHLMLFKSGDGIRTAHPAVGCNAERFDAKAVTQALSNRHHGPDGRGIARSTPNSNIRSASRCLMIS